MPTSRYNKNSQPQRGQLHPPERLEDRLAMDGAGFINTDPPEDPGSIVGVAEIVANDDYPRARRGTQSIRISPLVNDQLPEGSSKLSIKSVGETAKGAKVTISTDGKHLIYSAAGDEGFQQWDSFYYIVETEDGRLGKANVQLGQKQERLPGSSYSRPLRPIDLKFTLFEDSGEKLLDIVNHRFRRTEYEGAEIVAVTKPEGGGTIRIADDGRGLWYQPQYAYSGRDDVTVTLRTVVGTEQDFLVRISVVKPYQVVTKHDNSFVERGTGPASLSPLGNDRELRELEITPFIDSVSVPDYAGTIEPIANSRALNYSPAADFEGRFRIAYTVRYGEAEHQTVSAGFYVSVADGYQTVENYFLVNPDSPPTRLDVLANDWNYRERLGLKLRIIDVSTPSSGGTVTHNGSVVRYQPAAGYEGDETFIYTVESSSGARQTAQVTIEVAAREADPFGIPQFATRREFEQYLIDRAVQHYGQAFGRFEERYPPLPEGVLQRHHFETDTSLYATTAGIGNDHSTTNTQVDEVDEADIVETDGRYVYTLSGGKLAIVDLKDPSDPELVSLTEFETRIDEMYLQGDRLTLIHRGSPSAKQYFWQRYHYQELEQDDAVVIVLDITDRDAPTVLERTEIDGAIVDSRAIDSKVHLVMERGFEFPELGGRWVVEPELVDLDDLPIDPVTGRPYVDFTSQLGTRGVWANQTLEEYLASVRDQLAQVGLPSFTTYNTNGEVVASGLLTAPDNVHKPLSGEASIASVWTIDVGDATPGLAAEASSFIANGQTTVYMSTESIYLFAYNRQTDETTISKLDLRDDGSQPLVATGAIRGKLLNQFAADEHDGRLRVATTQQERRYFNEGRNWRQQRLFNNLLVIEQSGSQLNIVGQVVNLAPTETIKSVRFLGDRAFVVTFRVVDPLFSIDLSKPTTPVVRGALKIPGFSDYLHPVGDDFLLAIGRDADEITGQLGPFQITLFDVSDLDDPKVADQATFEGAVSTTSEAWIDHHAVSYFAESGVLAVPLAWQEEVTKEGSDGKSYQAFESREATWTFRVTTVGSGKIKPTGTIEHPQREPEGVFALNHPPLVVHHLTTNVWFPPRPVDPESMQRALRIGDTIVTVSQDWIQTHDLDNPEHKQGEVHLGIPIASDRYVVEEDSGANVFQVLIDDPPFANGERAKISAVGDVKGGTVEIRRNGQVVVFTPDDDFFGHTSFSYTVDAPFHGEVSARVFVTVLGTPDDPTAVNDTFVLGESVEILQLDVLANDLNPDYRVYQLAPYALDAYIFSSIGGKAISASNLATTNGLTIAEVGPTSSGATLEVSEDGFVSYSSVEGFVGIDSFSYTIRDDLGRTDTATATIYVGIDPPPEALGSGGLPAAVREVLNLLGHDAANLAFAGVVQSLEQQPEHLVEQFDGDVATRSIRQSDDAANGVVQSEPSDPWTESVDLAFEELTSWRLDREPSAQRRPFGEASSLDIRLITELATAPAPLR